MTHLFDILNTIYIQFTLQLLICEFIFVCHRTTRSKSYMRIPISFAMLVGAGAIWTNTVGELFLNGYKVLAALVYIGFAVFTFFWIWFNFEMNAMAVFFAVAGGYATEHMAFTVNQITLYFAGKFVEINENNLVILVITRFLIYILVAAVVYQFIVKKNGDKMEFTSGDYRIIAIAFVLMITAILMSVYYNDQQYAGTFLSGVICPMYGLISCLLVLFLVYYELGTKKMRLERESMEQLIRISEAQRKSSMESIDIINIKCHDLKHQIRALARMEDSEERSNYMRDVQETVSIYDAMYHTGHEALDYVLREKTLLSNEFGIKFSCMVDGNLLSFISSADMYALMSNAIDNAFECVEKETEEKRIVSLQIRKQRQMVLIHLENWCSIKPNFENGLPQTIKKDKQNHGFGVRSIQYVVNKYGGTFNMRAQDERFYLDILFQETVSADVAK